MSASRPTGGNCLWALALAVLSSVHLADPNGVRFTVPLRNGTLKSPSTTDIKTSVVLQCTFQYPLSTLLQYSWQHNGRTVFTSGASKTSLYTVSGLLPYDARVEGDYVCKVRPRPTEVYQISYTLRLLVDLEVIPVASVVEMGNLTTVTCRQTGYIRTTWRWSHVVDDDSGDDDVIITNDTRRSVYARKSSVDYRSAGSQTLALTLADARSSDAGQYLCAVEDPYTAPAAARIQVVPPAYYRGNSSGVAGSLTYSMPLEYRGEGGVSFRDYTYSGGQRGGRLVGGSGQLVDGELGGSGSLSSQRDRFPWVGWPANADTELIFTFADLRKISSITLHTLRSSPPGGGVVGVSLFGEVEISVSKNRQQWTTFTEDYFPGDNVTVPTLLASLPAVGYYVRVQLKDLRGPPGGVVLLSEVSFDSTVVPVSTGTPALSTTLVAGLVGGALLVVLLLAIIAVLATVLVCQKRRQELYASVRHRHNNYQAQVGAAANGSNNNGYSNSGFEQEEVYCEPDKQRGLPLSSGDDGSAVKSGGVDMERFERLDQNPLYKQDDWERPSEYAEIPREGSIRSANLPPLPPYRPGTLSNKPSLPPKNPSGAMATTFNIYSSADNIFEPDMIFEDIYSEAYDLTAPGSGLYDLTTSSSGDGLGDKEDTFSCYDTTDVGRVEPHSDLTPYSSVYAMPAPLDRSEGPKEVSAGNIEEVKPLGVGQFGEVVLAQTVGLSLKDLRLSDTDTDTSVKVSVAVKKLKEESQTSTREAFEKEIKFMSRLTHANVIRLLAVCLKGTPFIVMEYMEQGDLNQFMKKRQFSSSSSDYANTLDLRALVDIAKQIASGMEYLASKKFIHRDLATRNCLMGKNLTVKIADFGMSQNLYSDYYFRLKGRAVLPIRWMAYECFYGRFSIKTDVWAFGVTLWEVFTLGQKQPFDGWTDQEVIENAVKPSRGGESVKLAKPDLCPPEAYQLMLQCWSYESANRPSFAELHELLKTLNVAPSSFADPLSNESPL